MIRAVHQKIQDLVDRIAGLCSPEKIYIFSHKVNLENEVTSFKLCVVADTGDKLSLEQQIYLSLDCEIPYDVVVYTSEEWETFCQNDFSFAHSIAEKGRKVYDKTEK